ncbi:MULTISPECIES: hypothetical protein [unclassified Rhodococcus (in: high G+C Gram-positive bacteria)]|uniref:hypothetical protein n=1 Tax=unclassified Rhodococcus (in: high G+C Gram-positive bacteria) TaxID=192944 RepID=UPI001639D500|nr:MULTISPECIES: hypothetical protein [unclassified Rhodococcus (in: high G+C Gram-positive bacteria)]MBC2640548.1 hypothetical protein [Rhodococcus sp. 3A]MBC2894706.1 hypothetical protein [Rhodococcus sp. 4CII]
MVLDEVWRQLDDVEPLSGRDGGPLSRTVKLILDPLVIRPVQNPLCAGPLVTADGAQLLAARVYACADALRATAAWFTLLKRVRRTLRITDGNPQDLYFQRCYELATGSGPPDPLRDESVAEDTLRDVHEFAAGRTTQALKAHVTDPARARELTALIAVAWARRPLSAGSAGTHTDAIGEVLDACPGARLAQDGDGGRAALDSLIAGHAGTHHGIALWTTEVSARSLGLTVHPLPGPPLLGASASTTALGLPFDRSVHERVFTVLRASTDRAELSPIHELVTTEIARSCSPWALLDESLRVAATTGAALAVGLRPIGVAAAPAGTDTDTTAARVINGRWQREAYVLQARRLTVSPDAVSLPGTNPLAVLAAELVEPWRPYLRRLWVRLHGRDVREFSIHEPDELWDLLDGVARSVILDHRMRVKQALSMIPLADASDAPESRAS